MSPSRCYALTATSQPCGSLPHGPAPPHSSSPSPDPPPTKGPNGRPAAMAAAMATTASPSAPCGLREREVLIGYEKCQSPSSRRSVSLIGYLANRTTHYLSFSTNQRLALKNEQFKYPLTSLPPLSPLAGRSVPPARAGLHPAFVLAGGMEA